MPGVPKRPVRFQVRSLIDYPFLTPPPPPGFVIHRRGSVGSWIGILPLEMRATPHDQMRGTLPERIIYKYLTESLRFVEGADFDFQSCVGAQHLVLTSDMRWVEAGTLRVGDTLLSFSEFGDPMRKWEKGTVTFNSVEDMEAVKVKLSDGREIVTTPNHPWLVHYSEDKHDWGKSTGYSWKESQELKVGAYVPIFTDTWETDESKEAGWVSGFFDGEGAVVHGKTQSGGHCLSLTIGQNKSLMLDRFNQYVEQLGFEFTNYDYTGKHLRSYDDKFRKVIHCRLAGGRSECFRFLGSIRPAKLDYLKIDKLGKLTKIRQVRVVSVEPIGKVPIARLEVDNHTYIVEGFGMHNSLQGGRIDTGGIVADFIFKTLRVVINPLGPTHDEFLRIKKDQEQIDSLASMGYQVYMIPEDDIYDEPTFIMKMKQIFGWVHSGAGDTSYHSSELNQTLEALLGLEDAVASL